MTNRNEFESNPSIYKLGMKLGGVWFMVCSGKDDTDSKVENRAIYESLEEAMTIYQKLPLEDQRRVRPEFYNDLNDISESLIDDSPIGEIRRLAKSLEDEAQSPA